MRKITDKESGNGSRNMLDIAKKIGEVDRVERS